MLEANVIIADLSFHARNYPILRGMAGNDTLQGGKGSDTYIFDRVMASTRSESTTPPQALESIADGLGHQIDPTVVRQGWHKFANLGALGSTDGITVLNWYSTRASYRIESLNAAGDHKSLSADKVDALVNAWPGSPRLLPWPPMAP